MWITCNLNNWQSGSCLVYVGGILNKVSKHGSRKVSISDTSESESECKSTLLSLWHLKNEIYFGVFFPMKLIFFALWLKNMLFTVHTVILKAFKYNILFAVVTKLQPSYL